MPCTPISWWSKTSLQAEWLNGGKARIGCGRWSSMGSRGWIGSRAAAIWVEAGGDMSHYRVVGAEAEFEPGSSEMVLRNLLGIT